MRIERTPEHRLTSNLHKSTRSVRYTITELRDCKVTMKDL